MKDIFVIQTIIEILFIFFFIWGLFNEEKIAKFERKFFAKLFSKSKYNNS